MRDTEIDNKEPSGQELKFLFIGGPGNLRRLARSAQYSLEIVDCDIAGILNHPAHKPFHYYDVVVFWPTKRLYSLTDSFSQWQAAVNKSGSQLPRLHESIWSKRLTNEEVNWKGKSAPEDLSRKPSTSMDRALIIKELKKRCIRRLRNDVISGTSKGLQTFCVIPQHASRVRADAFEWISTHLGFHEAGHEIIERCSDPERTNPVAIDFLHKLPSILRQPVASSISMRRVTPSENEEVLDGDMSCWGEQWHPESFSADDRDILDNCSVQTFFPHRNGAGTAKTALLRPSDAGRSSTSSGFVLLMPEPKSWRALSESIVRMLRTIRDTQKAIIQDVFPINNRGTPCRFCGWVHNKSFTNIKNPDADEGMSFTGILPDLLKCIHGHLERGETFCDSKDSKLGELMGKCPNVCKAFYDRKKSPEYKTLFKIGKGTIAWNILGS